MTIQFDRKRRAWIADDITEVTGTVFNNLLKWGQPYNPYQAGLFEHEVYDSGAAEPPKIVFNNEDVLTRGFGQRIELQDFDVIRNLRTKQMSLADGKYTLKQLQKLGLSKPGRSGDHVITTDLYLNQDRLGVSEELGAGNAAYVFGSIKFQLADNTICVSRMFRRTCCAC